jgi:hypothetical protein
MGSDVIGNDGPVRRSRTALGLAGFVALHLPFGQRWQYEDCGQRCTAVSSVLQVYGITMHMFPLLIVMSLTLGQVPGGLDCGREDPLVPLPTYSLGDPLPRPVLIATSLVGRLLSLFLHEGMTLEQVRSILGRPSVFSMGSGGCCDFYDLFRLSVSYQMGTHVNDPVTVETVRWKGIPR